MAHSEARVALANIVAKGLSLPVEKAIRLALAVVAARILGDAVFGRYLYTSTLVAVLALGIDLGLHTWVVRALARDRVRAGVIIWTAMRARAGVIPLFLIALVIAAVVAPTPEERVAMGLLGVAALGNTFVDFVCSVLRGFERLRDEGLLNISRALLMVGGGLGALVCGRSLISLSVGLLGGAVAATLCAGWLLGRRRVLPRLARTTYDPVLGRTALREAIPMWLATLLSLLYFKGDVFLLRHYSGDAVVGDYSVAYKVFEGLMVFPMVVFSAALAPLARANDDPARRHRWERSLALAMLAMGAVLGALVYACCPWIVATVFGRAFQGAEPALRILSAAVPVVFLNYALTMFLIARDLERRKLLLATIMLVVNLAANLLLIPGRGGAGAAVATLVTELAYTSCCLLWMGSEGRARRRQRIEAA
jgi:PST family polysaccharide transporter